MSTQQLFTNISTTFNYSGQISSPKNHIAHASPFPFSLFSNNHSPTNPPSLMTMSTNYCFVDNISICNSLEAIFYSYGIMMTQATWESPLPSTVMTIIPVTDDPNSVH